MQLLFNGGHFERINWASTVSNALFANPFTAAGAASAFQFSIEDIQKLDNNTIFGKKSFARFGMETLIGGSANFAATKGLSLASKNGGVFFDYSKFPRLGNLADNYFFNQTNNFMGNLTQAAVDKASENKTEK